MVKLTVGFSRLVISFREFSLHSVYLLFSVFMLFFLVGLHSVVDYDATPAPIFVGNITGEPFIDVYGNMLTTTTPEPDFIPTTGSSITIPTVAMPNITLDEIPEPEVTCKACETLTRQLTPVDKTDAAAQASQAKAWLKQILGR